MTLIFFRSNFSVQAVDDIPEVQHDQRYDASFDNTVHFKYAPEKC